MASPWEIEVEQRFEQLKKDLADIIAQQFREGEERLATRLEERLAPRLAADLEERLAPRLEERLATRLEERLAPRLAADLEERLAPRLEERLATRLEERLGARLEERVDRRIQASMLPYMESMHDLVKRAAEGYGATLEGIERRLDELSTKWDRKIADHDVFLEDHGRRIAKLEQH